MSELNIGPKLMIMAGARYEHEVTTYDAFIADIDVQVADANEIGTVTEINSKRKFDSWFPMIHLRYRITDWLGMRLAKTKSLSRPNFNFLSPGEKVSFTNQTVSRGTPGLRPAISENIDLLIIETDLFENEYGTEYFKKYYNNILNIRDYTESLDKMFMLVLPQYSSKHIEMYKDKLSNDGFIVYPSVRRAGKAFLALFEYGKKLNSRNKKLTND